MLIGALSGVSPLSRGELVLAAPPGQPAHTIGFTLSAYAVFLGQALLNLTPMQNLFVFAASFLVTGWIVGFFSPGVTMVEPAIAAGGMVILDAGFVILWFDALPRFQTTLIGFGGGVVLALAGGWLGEKTQKLREGRKQ